MIEKVVHKVPLAGANTDAVYWRRQPPVERLKALEEIRREYHTWRYDSEPRLQRVYRVIKQA